jgi:hypothetical protein
LVETERRGGEQTTHYGPGFSRKDAVPPYDDVPALWETGSHFETTDPPEPDVDQKDKLRKMYDACANMATAPRPS